MVGNYDFIVDDNDFDDDSGVGGGDGQSGKQRWQNHDFVPFDGDDDFDEDDVDDDDFGDDDDGGCGCDDGDDDGQ